MDAYESADGRYIQERVAESAANALSVSYGVVPGNRVWTVLSGCYYPSVAETRTVQWKLYGRSGYPFPVTFPAAVALSPNIFLPLVSEGMELKLFPGEFLRVDRDVATAGSTMLATIRVIETDLPFYKYTEPLNRVMQSAVKHGSVYRATGGVSVGGGPGAPHGPGAGGGGGGGGGAEPV